MSIFFTMGIQKMFLCSVYVLGSIFQITSTATNLCPIENHLLLDKVQYGFCPYTQEEWFDITRGTFLTSTKALYWFHFSAGVPTNTKTSYGVQLSSEVFVGINKSNTAFPDDQVTTDALRWISAGSKLSITSKYNLFNNAPVSQTAWLWLRLDSFITPLVAFHVALATSLTSNSSVVPVPFEKVIVNEGDGWNPVTYKFSPPVAGIYYFSFGTATISNSKAEMDLLINGVSHFVAAIWETSLHNNLETCRTTTLLNLLTTDDIFCGTVHAGHYFEGNSNNQNYFMGFLYNPTLSEKIAWNVAHSSSFTGPLDYVQYDKVHVNEGGVWNSTTNSANILVSGLYIVDLSSYFCGSGCIGNGNQHLQLLLNGNPIIELKLMAFTANDGISRSRTVAVQMTKGDHMRVRAVNNGSYVSAPGQRYLNLFSGFLINSLN